MPKDLIRILILASLYVILGHLAFNEAVGNSIVTPVLFTSEGVALAFTLVFGPRMAVGVFLGQLILALTSGLSLGTSLGVAIVNSIEALIAWRIAGLLPINPALRALKDYVFLVMLILLVLQPFSALLGNLILLMSDLEAYPDFFFSSIKWWIGNSMGQILFAPIIMLFITKAEPLSRYRIVDFIPVLLLPLLVFLVFDDQLLYLPIAISCVLPLLLWSAYNRTLLLLSLTCLLSSLILIHITGRGFGPIAAFGEWSFAALNILIAGFTITAQFICVLFIELKQQETALKSTVDFENLNRQLRYALDATGDALWDWDLSTDIVTHNSQWCRLTGLGDDYLSHPVAGFTQLLHEEDKALVWERLQACLTDNGPYLSEHRLSLPSGRIIWVLDRGNVVERDQHGQPLRMMGTFLDVTYSHEKALAQREDSFQRAAERLQLILRGSNDAWWDWDLVTGFLFLSPSWWTMLGYANKELSAAWSLWQHFMHPDDLAKVGHIFGHTLEADSLDVVELPSENFTFEFRLRHKDGHYVTVLSRGIISRNDSGKVIRLSGINTDLTERKLAEQALKASEQKFKAILEASPDSIGISSLEGICVYSSPKTQVMWGYTEEEFKGMPIYQVIAPGSYELANHVITELLKGNYTGSHIYETIRKDGSHFYMEGSASLLYDSDNNPANILFFQRDVTQRILASEELALAKRTAEQASQAKSHFVSHISHELRTPLNIILGYSELLIEDDSIDAKHMEYLSEISKGGKHLLKLINEMLDIAKIEAGLITISIRNENISKLIDECLVSIKPIAKKRGIHLNYEAQDEVITGCDGTRLIQVLLNLISNAVKYNIADGSVDISLEMDSADSYTIHVIDSGLGIEPEQLEPIFEPYVRLSSNEGQEGTGLGLNIAKKLVTAMGGTIGVSSELGQGSHFWINLPCRVDTHEEKLPDSPPLLNNQSDTTLSELTRQIKVLYIDDHDFNLKLVVDMLDTAPHIEIKTLQDPTQAITQASVLHPDMILLDINMPVMNGYEVLAELKANDQLKTIPVIALTANAMLNEVELGLEAGFSQYLAKPVIRTDLIHTIEQIMSLNL